jgi:molybdenum cofactor cytidylyltransferase
MNADAILMASGFSRRFGEADKLLQMFEGKPLASYALELACGMPELARVIFVTASGEVERLATGTRAVVIRNAAPERGMRESVRLGVGESRARYYCLFPCDQPLLDEETVRAILSAARPGAIVEPVAGGARRSPSLFASEYRGELLAIPPGENGRHIKERHRSAVVPVEFGRVRIFSDIDTLDELNELEGVSSCTR